MVSRGYYVDLLSQKGLQVGLPQRWLCRGSTRHLCWVQSAWGLRVSGLGFLILSFLGSGA